MWHQIHYSAWEWKLLTVVWAFRGARNWRTKILLPLLSSIRLTTQYDLLIAWKWWLVSRWSWAHSYWGCACETFQGWSREEKNLCLEETESSFKYSGKILRTIISQWRANTHSKKCTWVVMSIRPAPDQRVRYYFFPPAFIDSRQGAKNLYLLMQVWMMCLTKCDKKRKPEALSAY